jgi:hypothetical protein
MRDIELEGFRKLAQLMNPEPHDWQWIGKYVSQRMFNITEQRAKGYAARFGGEARKMEVL